MRILQITPGTGNFHCGSCERDVALVHELRRRGHDVACMPLYLPFVVDALDPSDTPLFFGGVNVYLQQHSGIFRRTPRWLDGLLDRPGLLRWSARHAHLTRPEDLGELTLSMLRGGEGQQVKELDRMMAWLRTEPPFDLVCLSNALLLGLARPLQQQLGLPVACTLHGEDTFIDRLPPPFRDRVWDEIRTRAAAVEGLLPVSTYYRDAMCRRLGLPASRFQVVYNGVDLSGCAPRPGLPDPPVVGYLARMCEDKGLPLLVESFIRLRRQEAGRRARLHIAGACTPGDRPLVKAMQARLADEGLAPEARFLPNLERDEKRRFLQGLSVLSVPAMYGECFGLYLLEAMGCGVPVVQPRHGAFPEVVEATGGGMLFDPADAQALADALAGLLGDPARNEKLGAAGREQVMARFGLEHMADRVVEAYASLVADRDKKRGVRP